MISSTDREEYKSRLVKSGVEGRWWQVFTIGAILLAIHDELELIRKALTEKPSQGGGSASRRA